MREPPAFAIQHAIAVAKNSPCAKTRRGAIVFRIDPVRGYETLGAGWNHPPNDIKCDGSAECRKDCGRRCVHAEVQAIRHAWHESVGWLVELVHVKIDSDGKLETGGGLSCWQCSRKVLDAGIAAVWLYQSPEPRPLAGRAGAVMDGMELPSWRRYTAVEFHRVTCENAKGGPVYVGGAR